MFLRVRVLWALDWSSESIATAFGYDGLGLITVRDVPTFAELRKELLPLAFKYLFSFHPNLPLFHFCLFCAEQGSLSCQRT